jgi:nucleotide-binding universal stress UspA family protein
MKLIIAVTDFSKNGNNAVKYAASLAKEFTSRLIIAHVFTTIKNNSSNNYTGEVELKTEIGEKLVLMKNNLGIDYDIDIETHLLTGESTAESIITFADRMQADLLVAGNTGTNILERVFMGSTAARLIRKSNCAILCIPANSEFTPYRTIAFATDLKEDNLNGALSLITFADHFDAEICFLFVDDRDMIRDEKTIGEMTSRIRLRVKYPRISGYVTKLTDISKGIQYFVKQKDVQMIAMYTHSSSANEKISDSVTASVSNHLHIPLLALKKGVVSLVS